MPALDDCRFIIVSKLVIVISSFELDISCLLVPSPFIIIPLKYQLIFGTGSPVALQANVTGSVSFLSSLVTSTVISA